MILVVEDSKLIAMTLKAQFGQYVPDAEVVFVADAEDAVKALTGENFAEYDPKGNAVSPRGPCKFTAVVWDNHLPEFWGAQAETDVGLHTVESLSTTPRIDKTLLSRFISHSSDDAKRFVDSNRFIRVYHKPMNVQQIQEIGELFREWSISTPRSEDLGTVGSLEESLNEMNVEAGGFEMEMTDPHGGLL